MGRELFSRLQNSFVKSEDHVKTVKVHVCLDMTGVNLYDFSQVGWFPVETAGG